MVVCAIQYCQLSEIMHVMMGSTHRTYTLDKKRERVCVFRKRLEDRPSEALSAAYNEPRRSRHVRQDVNGGLHEEAPQGNYTRQRQIAVCVNSDVKNSCF